MSDLNKWGQYVSDPRNTGGSYGSGNDNPGGAKGNTDLADTMTALPVPPPPSLPSFPGTGIPDRVFDKTTGDTAKRRALEEQAKRRGRASTILTGGPGGGEHLGI